MFDQVNDWNAWLKSSMNQEKQNLDMEKLREIQSFLTSPGIPSHSAQVLELWTRFCLFLQRFSLQTADQIREWYKKAKESIAPSALSSSSILFIQWAEFELSSQRMAKALSILQMALELEAQPAKHLQTAITGIMEQNRIPVFVLDLEQYFQATDFDAYRERLDGIFASLSRAKEAYKREELAAEEAFPEELDFYAQDAFEKMEQRLKMFQETLDSATQQTKTLLSTQNVKESVEEDETLPTSKHTLSSTSSISKRISSSSVRLDLSQLMKPALTSLESAPEKETLSNEVPIEKEKNSDGMEQEKEAISYAVPIEKINAVPTEKATSIPFSIEKATSYAQPQPTSSSIPVELTSPSNSNFIVSVSSGDSSERRPKIIQINARKYQILQLVGKGGSSKVYKVIGTDFQIYALKRVRLKGLDSATINGYLNEIELLQRLSSNPWIIKLLDTSIEREKHNLYLLMEYGEVDLASMLADKKRQFPKYPTNDSTHVNFIRYFWEQILHSVASIHHERIIHCDLKPANFLLVKGTLKLIDFGISKAIASNETANVVRENQVGTVNYMAPEALGGCQGENLKIGRPSDVWSLGCILYEMVYGNPPFAEFNIIVRLQKIIDSSYSISFPPLENAELLDSIKGCLCREASKRYTIPRLLAHPFLQSNCKLS